MLKYPEYRKGAALKEESMVMLLDTVLIGQEYLMPHIGFIHGMDRYINVELLASDDPYTRQVVEYINSRFAFHYKHSDLAAAYFFNAQVGLIEILFKRHAIRDGFMYATSLTNAEFGPQQFVRHQRYPVGDVGGLIKIPFCQRKETFYLNEGILRPF